MTCPHPNPALCQLLRRHMVGRLWDIWTGTVLTPDQCQRYRELFCRTAGVEIEEAYAVAPWDMLPSASRPAVAEKADDPDSLPCIDRGPKIRDEVCKPCQNAGHSTIPVYQCHVFGECVLRGTVAPSGSRPAPHVCLTCQVRKPPVAVTAEQPAPSEPLPAQIALPRHPLPKHVTRWAVGITSAPRRVPTVARCAASVQAAGFDPIIYAEPDTNGLPDDVPVVHRPQRLGCFHNYLQTLRDLLSTYPDAQAIVVFQDDVIICRDVREFLEHDLWPSDLTGAVSLYSPDFYNYEGKAESPDFKRIKGKYLMGACAMIYPRRVAEAFVTRHTEWRGRAMGHEPDPVRKKAVDTWIGHAVAGERLHVYYPTVSLCQHIAETSALGHGGADQIRRGRHYRRSGLFPGEDASAFEVFASSRPRIRFNGDPGVRLDRPLSVIIPAWNCPDLTAQCLRALAENGGVEPLDVIYVDNGSDPGVVDEVEALAKSLELPLRTVRFPENRGFCPAANAGLRLAVDHQRHALLLNNDCYVCRGCIPALIRHMLSDQRVATVGPLTDDQGSQSITRNPALRRQRGSRKSLDRMMVAGFCQLKRYEALSELGLLDENLPHGLGTDDDWCHRARQAGWKVLLALDAFANHEHKSTFRRSGQDRAALQKDAMRYLRTKGVL